MQLAVITLFPGFFTNYFSEGVVGRSIQTGILKCQLFNPRDYSDCPHKTVDDKPYGGGPGMVMKMQPLIAALNAAKTALGQEDIKVIYLSPQGQTLKQSMLQKRAKQDSKLILVCGRYAGIDQRFIDNYIDEELSIGDFVLSGGELPALVFIDAIARLIPGTLGDADSALDSFSQGLLDHPHYTRPAVYNQLEVPKVLQSGDHKAIQTWRNEMKIKATQEKRPDLLK